ncbi:MAG: hypothetical protein ACYDAG_06180 [Chloroflexota bacterium]
MNAGYAIDPRVASVQGPVSVSQPGTPSDPLYPQQWALARSGTVASPPVSSTAMVALPVTAMLQ